MLYRNMHNNKIGLNWVIFKSYTLNFIERSSQLLELSLDKGQDDEVDSILGSGNSALRKEFFTSIIEEFASKNGMEIEEKEDKTSNDEANANINEDLEDILNDEIEEENCCEIQQQK